MLLTPLYSRLRTLSPFQTPVVSLQMAEHFPLANVGRFTSKVSDA